MNNRYPRPDTRGLVIWGVSISITWLVVIAIVFVSIIAGTFVYLRAEGILISQHQSNIRHSINFVDAHNSQMRALVSQYDAEESDLQATTDPGKVSTIKMRQKDHLAQICGLSQEISSDEVVRDVSAFLATHRCP